MLPKLGRLLIPGEMPGRFATDGGLTLGRVIEGRPMSGREPRSMLGLLLIPSEGRETDGLGLGRDEGRLLTLGSEGRLEGMETLGRDMPPPVGREMLGLGRDMPPLGRPPPPMPIDGRAAPPPRPPPPGPRPEDSGISVKLDTPISRMPSEIGLIRRIMIVFLARSRRVRQAGKPAPRADHLLGAGGRRTIVTS
jgi:hypothetical protein